MRVHWVSEGTGELSGVSERTRAMGCKGYVRALGGGWGGGGSEVSEGIWRGCQG